ncbi:shikimate 5-dehydrogenase [alpha proteobacterium BAL199]|jgi:shikimate dehydrogenase|nr:shikimate 5-dehydrogenase [alpha proteobacterium BAL199]
MVDAASFPGPIGNPVTIATGRYAAILGATPSKGARSPTLWNAAFKAAGIDAVMHPMDVTAADLPAVVAALKADPRFVGGAVAVPHKQALVGLLDRIEPEAQRIGAVNAIYRDGDALVGANTDGAGALSQIEELVGGAHALQTRRALVVGLGGAGLAVAAFLAGRVTELTVANRTRATADAVATKLGAMTADFPVGADVLSKIDLVVNATTIGHKDGSAGSPVDEAGLAVLPASAAVYDAIYQPDLTPLLTMAAARGLQTRNGLGMNLDQAVIAFGKAVPGALGMDAVRAAMRAA